MKLCVVRNNKYVLKTLFCIEVPTRWYKLSVAMFANIYKNNLCMKILCSDQGAGWMTKERCRSKKSFSLSSPTPLNVHNSSGVHQALCSMSTGVLSLE
jgi:hypothetical protein